MNVRAGSLLLALVALGEMTVGALVAAFPSMAAVLIGASLDGSGLLVARMMGVAVLAIGLTWWLARDKPALAAADLPGFILYNLGVGALFGLAATSASQPLIPWILAVAHVAAAATYGALAAMTPSFRDRSS